MKNTAIEWADHTFNPWWGCVEVGPECANCYARQLDKRFGGDHWGRGTPRKLQSDKYWKQPLAWNRDTPGAFVFCASMGDVMEDHPELADLRLRLYSLITQTDNLTWLLLTKRPENYPWFLPSAWLHHPRPNVWLGATAGTQPTWERNRTHLLRVPAVKHFLSAEPLLEAVDLRLQAKSAYRLDWVICGGESGSKRRPMQPDWARSLRDQCQDASVPFFFKQWGPEGAGRLLDGREWNERPEAGSRRGSEL